MQDCLIESVIDRKDKMTEPSQYEKDTRIIFEKFEKRLNANLERIWDKLDEVQKGFHNYLPRWATIYISLLLFLVGILGTTIVSNLK